MVQKKIMGALKQNFAGYQYTTTSNPDLGNYLFLGFFSISLLPHHFIPMANTIIDFSIMLLLLWVSTPCTSGTKDKMLLSSTRVVLDARINKPRKPTKPILHDQITPITNPVTTPITVPSTNPAATFPTSPTIPFTNPVTTPINFPKTDPTPITVNPSTIPPPTNPAQSWCAAKPEASDTAIQNAIDYACGIGGVDCSAIQQSGSCFNPDTLRDHASFAFNSYYQQKPNPDSCNFGGAAMLVSTNPISCTKLPPLQDVPAVTNPTLPPPSLPYETPVINPPRPRNGTPGGGWCVAKTDATDAALKDGIDYACGIGGVDCSMLQQSGSCYTPNTLRAHASYAFNSYYQNNPNPASCDFGGTATLVHVNPSSETCVYLTSSLTNTGVLPSELPGGGGGSSGDVSDSTGMGTRPTVFGLNDTISSGTPTTFSAINSLCLSTAFAVMLALISLTPTVLITLEIG